MAGRLQWPAVPEGAVRTLTQRSVLRTWGVAGVALAGAGVLSLSLMTAGASTSRGAGRTTTGSASPTVSATTSATASPTPRRSSTAVRTSARRSSTAPVDNRVVSALAANGIPGVALLAYRRAAARLSSADPSCGVPWYLVAAIGKVESDHGRYGGAVLHANGDSAPHIVGIALDGSRSALIRDTDGGRLDGDTVYDHAVGPMQFIPGTWAAYAVDGNGDGVASVFNVFDAALATAHYLCVAGGDLRTAGGVQRAILAYNDSAAYLSTVVALANAYAHGIAVTGPVGGQTTGALPPVKPGPVPPANPAPPPVLSTGGSTGSGAGHTSGRPTSAHPTSRPSTRPTTAHPTGRASSPRPSSSRTTSAAPTSAPTTRAPVPVPTTPTLPTPTTCHLNVLGICI